MAGSARPASSASTPCSVSSAASTAANCLVNEPMPEQAVDGGRRRVPGWRCPPPDHSARAVAPCRRLLHPGAAPCAMASPRMRCSVSGKPSRGGRERAAPEPDGARRRDAQQYRSTGQGHVAHSMGMGARWHGPPAARADGHPAGSLPGVGLHHLVQHVDVPGGVRGDVLAGVAVDPQHVAHAGLMGIARCRRRSSRTRRACRTSGPCRRTSVRAPAGIACPGSAGGCRLGLRRDFQEHALAGAVLARGGFRAGEDQQVAGRGLQLQLAGIALDRRRFQHALQPLADFPRSSAISFGSAHAFMVEASLSIVMPPFPSSL